ncbi:DUF1758 domain-containing protein [Trichonephila clavipes]|nr:DUF1758 domain-containing protein [Trichonephila clavipes]
MRSTKDQLVKKDVLMPVKQCFPVEPSGCRRDSPLVSMEVPLRTAYGQNGRCGMQPKAKHSLRAQAQLMRTETVETFELVKVEPKLLRERRENARGARAGAIPSKAKIIDLEKLIESRAVYKNDIEFVRSLVANALEESKQEAQKNEREAEKNEREAEKNEREAEKNEREAEIQLEKIKLSQIEKQLELPKVRKESEKIPQTLESGKPGSITDKLESLKRHFKSNPRKLSVEDRVEVVKRNNLCFRCFLPHRLKECRSEKNCFCLRPHNSLIHFSRDKTRNPTPTSNLNLDAPTFVPGQIEGSVEANSQSQFVATVFENELS